MLTNIYSDTISSLRHEDQKSRADHFTDNEVESSRESRTVPGNQPIESGAIEDKPIPVEVCVSEAPGPGPDIPEDKPIPVKVCVSPVPRPEPYAIEGQDDSIEIQHPEQPYSEEGSGPIVSMRPEDIGLYVNWTNLEIKERKRKKILRRKNLPVPNRDSTFS
ncbi:hypothetical protein BDV23DRAFT_184219 [Aspergillus alliaceus]|uniref:Uncharacterized protein n=1 Tax=Petromyces alliaceus TaxID=209559 RepID=A0A5N7C7C8_PETAA|nr:hypothetical protein BDV23DRAFT_184219 [Aspergillus alliaceus]